MFAVIAAILFGIGLIFALLGRSYDVINTTTLTLAGLLFLALHFTGAGAWRRR